MEEAIKEARKAEGLAEVPIGAVVVLDGKIIGRGHNLRNAATSRSACGDVCDRRSLSHCRKLALRTSAAV